MKTPQIIIIVLYFLNLLTHAAMHGERRKDKYNFHIAIMSAILGIGLLYWGGFFS